MKSRLFLGVILLAIIFSFVLSGCHKPTDPDDDDDYADVNENVVNTSEMNNLSEPVINGDTYTYSYTGTAPSINVGDVLVGQTGYGYMRKVTGVQTQNNQIVCQTDSARIVDVIDDCSINGSAQLTLGDLGKGAIPMQQVYLADGVSVTKDGSYHIESRNLLDSASFGMLRIKNTTLSYDPNIIFDLDVNNGEVTKLEITAVGTTTTSCTIEALNLRESVPITELPPIAQYMSIMPYFFIGPVPVFCGVELCPVFEFSLPTPLTNEWTFTNSTTLTAGARILPSFSPILDIEDAASVSNSVVNYDLGDGVVLKVGLTPRVKMLIGGVVGPKLGPVVYGKLTGGYEEDIYTARLLAGMDLKIKLSFDAFAYELASISYTANCFETELYSWSNPVQTVATPYFNPPSGAYEAPLTVSLDCATSGAMIRYTVDGSDPTESSSLFSPYFPLQINYSTTIKARGFKNGLIPSSIATATYSINPTPTVATPTFSPPGGTYSSPQSVSLSCTTSGSTIKYTIDGSDPSESSTQYATPISVSSSTTIKAKGFKDGWTPSAIATALYNISTNDYQVCDFPQILLGEWYDDPNNVWNISIRNIPPYRIRTGNIYYWPQSTHFNGNRYRVLTLREGTSEEYTFFFENVTTTTMDANLTLGNVWEPVGGFTGHHKN